MIIPQKLDPIVERFVRSRGFTPDNRHNVFVAGDELVHGHWNNNLPDPKLRYWRRQERLEDGDILIPWSVELYFYTNNQGRPFKLLLQASPMLTARRYSTMTINGANKILAFFDLAVQNLVNNQQLYRTCKGREAWLKVLSDNILRGHIK